MLSNGDFISCSRDNKIKITDLNGNVKATLTGCTGMVSSLTLLHDDELASASYDDTIHIWSIHV